MTEKDFTNRIDGLINDYEGGESTSKELRDGILDTLIELVSKVSPFEAPVKPNFANIKKEYENEFTVEEKSTLFNIPKYRRLTINSPDELWKWFEQKLKEVSKISV